jgi:hypothetical protein
VMALALFLLLIVGGATYFVTYQPKFRPASTEKIESTQARLERGRYLAEAVLGCFDCHADHDVKKYALPAVGPAGAGGVCMGQPGSFPGVICMPNITPDRETGLGGWTDGEIIRAIREGVHQSDRSLLVMPTQVFSNMSDEDVQAVVAYLRSQPPAGEPTPENRWNVIGALFINLVDFQTARAPVGQVSAPPPDTLEYGGYMISIIGCRDCHGDQLQGKVESGQPGPPPGPNLTQSMPGWTEAEFLTFFNTGQRPDGSAVPLLTLADGSTRPRMPWTVVRASTTDAELKAIYNYLHNLPPEESPTP